MLIWQAAQRGAIRRIAAQHSDMYVCVYVCVCVCMYVLYIYIYTYIHTHIQIYMYIYIAICPAIVSSKRSETAAAANLPTNIVDFTWVDSTMLCL